MNTPSKNNDDKERIAKRLSRAGVASRRDAEAMVLEGRVAVNGVVLKTPATLVGPHHRVTVDDRMIDAPEPARLWRFYKPRGLVTTARDEKGRDTIFDALPPDMPRVMPVGRLDLTSEGLLLLTNDGGLKRRLELPATGWLRKYRVRVHGDPTEAVLQPLLEGITVDRIAYQPMLIQVDRRQGANAWLTVGLREGKNREIRRAMEAVGLPVTRLIRISYGPFRLGEMEPGEVEEIREKVMRDQLGDGDIAAEPRARAAARPRQRPASRRSGPARWFTWSASPPHRPISDHAAAMSRPIWCCCIIPA